MEKEILHLNLNGNGQTKNFKGFIQQRALVDHGH
jgi:hypothetical protein